MPGHRLSTPHLELRPVPAAAAAALPGDRERAGQEIGALLHDEWPDPHLLGILRRHAGAPADTECFGVWVMIERASGAVVGDIGFHGPPDRAGTVEIGYSVVPSRRRRGYAKEAAGALVEWAATQPGVRDVVAGCDPGNVASIRTLEQVGFERTGGPGTEIRWRHAGRRTRTGAPGAH